MFTRTTSTATILLLTINMVWLAPVAAKGPPIKVEQAIPSEAEQGQKGLPVKIKGRNFGPGSTVRYLVAGTNNASQIDVLSVVFNEATGDLDTVIDVDDGATVSTYDIEVMRSGRGGKGTDLFRVNSKGGGNDYTTGCLVYRDDSVGPEVDEIQSDGFDPIEYCHGTDGQVTLPTVLRHDLKKFNGNGRTIIVHPVCWGGENLPIGAACFSRPAEARILQSRGEGDSAGIYAGNDVKLPTMGYLEVTRISLDFDLSKQRHVYFGNGTFVDDATQACGPVSGTEGKPAWIRCDAVDSGRCIQWTVSSDDLRSGPDAVNPVWPDDARACLVHWKGNSPIVDGNVEADFEFYLFEQ